METRISIGEYKLSLNDSALNTVWANRCTGNTRFAGQFALHPHVHYVQPASGRDSRPFLQEEIEYLLGEIARRLNEFAPNQWDHYFVRPAHHRRLTDAAERAPIETSFNPAEHWEYSARLDLFCGDHPERAFDRSFVLDALTDPTLTPARVQAAIQSSQEGFFTYDNPPDPKVYFREAAVPMSPAQGRYEEYVLYSIEGLAGVVLLEGLRRYRGYRTRVRVSEYLALDGSIYRPFRRPGSFYDARQNRPVYIQ